MLIRMAVLLVCFVSANLALAQTTVPDRAAPTVQERPAPQPGAPEAQVTRMPNPPTTSSDSSAKGPLGNFRPLNQIACEFLGPCGRCDCSPAQPQTNAPK